MKSPASEQNQHYSISLSLFASGVFSLWFVRKVSACEATFPLLAVASLWKLMTKQIHFHWKTHIHTNASETNLAGLSLYLRDAQTNGISQFTKNIHLPGTQTMHIHIHIYVHCARLQMIPWVFRHESIDFIPLGHFLKWINLSPCHSIMLNSINFAIAIVVVVVVIDVFRLLLVCLTLSFSIAPICVSVF